MAKDNTTDVASSIGLYLRVAFKVLVGRPEGKAPLTRPKRKLEDNIVDWIQQAQSGFRWWAFMNTVMNIRIP